MLTGCKSTRDAIYYDTMSFFGQEKRDILVDRVDDARDSQADAKEEFASALDQFQSVVEFDGGNLEKTYRKLESAFEDSEEQAGDVRERINEVEDVAQALFDEWRAELNQFTDASLRRSSEQQLRETERQYDALILTMRRTESKMDPVLNAFRDQVLYLKHNLNARAISSLEDTAAELETDVAALIEDMERSIAEADAFITEIRG